jgi:hypothetical protein
LLVAPAFDLSEVFAYFLEIGRVLLQFLLDDQLGHQRLFLLLGLFQLLLLGVCKLGTSWLEDGRRGLFGRTVVVARLLVTRGVLARTFDVLSPWR